MCELELLLSSFILDGFFSLCFFFLFASFFSNVNALVRASVRVHRVFNFSEDILEDLQLFIFRALLDARGMEIECNSFIIHVSVRIYLSLAFFLCVFGGYCKLLKVNQKGTTEQRRRRRRVGGRRRVDRGTSDEIA